MLDSRKLDEIGERSLLALGSLCIFPATARKNNLQHRIIKIYFCIYTYLISILFLTHLKSLMNQNDAILYILVRGGMNQTYPSGQTAPEYFENFNHISQEVVKSSISS